MSYKNVVIKDMIEDISQRKYVLPSIQREFVWSMEQVERLFDSLMREYPINTFLFWQVKEPSKYTFYDFLQAYDERDPHNTPIGLVARDNITAVLDGQQRMTSLYLGLSGSYTVKKPYTQKTYITKKLYLNLRQSKKIEIDEDDDAEYEAEFEFKFLTDEEAKKMDNAFWFECKEVLEWEKPSEIRAHLKEKGFYDIPELTEEDKDFALDTLENFFHVINKTEAISYHLEKTEELNKVLEIFIRTNSGGRKLDYSDLLLSIATAKWKKEDARKEINDFVDEIKKVGSGFKFNKDTVLKACLVLCEIGDVKFKMENFSKANMETIESNWDAVSSAMRAAVNLVSKLGYNDRSLRSKNAVIPIAYFIYKNNFADSILNKDERSDDRKAIKKWLARVLIKGVFGGMADNLYPPMSKMINKNLGSFPLEKIIEHYKGKKKSISFSEDEVDNLLESKYGDPATHSALLLLYSDIKGVETYHQDHIHPKYLFKKENIDDEKFKQFWENKDKISNLQLMLGTTNEEKSSNNFHDWLDKKYSGNQSHKESFLRDNFIDINQSLKFDDFLDFCEKRKNTIKAKFMDILGVVKEEKSDTDDDHLL